MRISFDFTVICHISVFVGKYLLGSKRTETPALHFRLKKAIKARMKTSEIFSAIFANFPLLINQRKFYCSQRSHESKYFSHYYLNQKQKKPWKEKKGGTCCYAFSFRSLVYNECNEVSTGFELLLFALNLEKL